MELTEIILSDVAGAEFNRFRTAASAARVDAIGEAADIANTMALWAGDMSTRHDTDPSLKTAYAMTAKECHEVERRILALKSK